MRFATIAAALALTAGLGVVGPPATAARAGATPNRCAEKFGDDFKILDSHFVRNVKKPHKVFGVAYLTYNHQTGANCAWTEKVIDRGERSFTKVELCNTATGECVGEASRFKIYAGPAQVVARAQCVRLSARINGPKGAYGLFTSESYHCGA
ncbi:hypothetical protein [Nonomuraea sp. NPDC046570]|uniref:hypothetical protein n=1 Tax=Nonomuraea sp. NPDC046570 TaxID=3155255 RepID=UPI00340F1EB5